MTMGYILLWFIAVGAFMHIRWFFAVFGSAKALIEYKKKLKSKKFYTEEEVEQMRMTLSQPNNLNSQIQS